MSNRTFLFVNKDAASSSLTRSASKEQSDINSYVQRGRRHRRSGNASSRRRPPVKEKEPPPLTRHVSSRGGSSSPSGSSTSSGSIATVQPSGFGVITLDGGHATLTPEQSFSEQRRGSQEEAAAARLRTAQQTSDDLVSFATPTPDPIASRRGTPFIGSTLSSTPQDISQFANNPIDPFGKSSIAIDAKAHSLIEYYKLVYHPAVWHVETKANNKGSYGFQKSATEVIRSALHSDVDMYALLACMSSRLTFVDKQPAMYETDEYLGKALAATRRVLKDRPSEESKSNEEILMVIFHLYATEGYRDNTEAAKIHMRAARTIIDILGGLANLRDPQMRELFIIGDGLLSAMTLDPCMLPCEFDPGSYQQAVPPELRLDAVYDLSDFAPALREGDRQALIPVEIQQLIRETAEINWALINAESGSPEASQHALRWIQIRSMAVRHRLLGLDLLDHRLKAFCGALVLWIVTSTTLLGQLKLRFRIAPKLRIILREARNQKLEWRANADIRAWVLSLGAMCCIPGRGDDDVWFVRQLSELITQNGDVDGLMAGNEEERILKRLEHLQQRFFYHEAVFGPWLRVLAKNLVAHGREVKVVFTA